MTETKSKRATNGPWDLAFALVLMLAAFVVIALWSLWIVGVILGIAGFVYLILWLVRSGRKS